MPYFAVEHLAENKWQSKRTGDRRDDMHNVRQDGSGLCAVIRRRGVCDNVLSRLRTAGAASSTSRYHSVGDTCALSCVRVQRGATTWTFLNTAQCACSVVSDGIKGLGVWRTVRPPVPNRPSAEKSDR